MNNLLNKNIGICINSLDMGGAERVAVTLLNYFSGFMHVHLICLERQEAYSVDNRIPVHYLSKMTGKENNLFKFLMLPVLALRISRLCSKYQIQILQSHLSRANYVNLLAKILGAGHIPHIVIHGITGEYKRKGLKGIINLLIIQIFYRRAGWIFVNSQGVRNDLEAYLKGGTRIKLIPNPFNIQEILNSCKEKIKQSVFRFIPDTDYIITVGRLIDSKRHLDLLEAFKEVTSRIKNCELLILGEGEEEETLRIYINENNLTGKAHILGRVKNPYQYLYRSKLFVSASESESFGNVIIEAMACSCPVIAVDCPYGPREILSPESDPGIRLTDTYEESPYGILVPVRSPKPLAAAMIKMLKNEALRINYLEQGNIRCRAYEIGKIGKLYKEMLIEDLTAV
jgi:glycosyltransferase involved in cell wall biosynthesis